MANHSENRGHRPKIEIDFKMLKNLCSLQCTEQEIALWFGCGIGTIASRIKEETGLSFHEFFESNRVGGLISLRRNLFRLAQVHPQMAIFLAKNWLKMKDTQEIKVRDDSIIENYSDEQLSAILDERGCRRATKTD